MAGYTKSTVLKLSSEITDLREALDSMLIESVECVRLEDMTNELREAIQVGNELLHGPKSEYISHRILSLISVRFSALLLRYSEVKYLICSTTR